MLDLSKIFMYDFRYDYVKPKYCEKASLCYMDADSSTLYRKKIFIKILQKILKLVQII